MDKTAHFCQPKKGSLMDALSSLGSASQLSRATNPATRKSPPASVHSKSPAPSIRLQSSTQTTRPKQT